MEYKRKEGESEEELVFRICKDKDIIGTWDDVAKILNELTGNEYTESKYRKQYQAFQKMFASNTEDKVSKSLREEMRALSRERMKLQTEKLEYNKWLREQSRDEMLMERIEKAIHTLPPLEVPDVPVRDGASGKSYLLAFGDCHYGIEFELKDMFGQTINKYSPEIFQLRMAELLLKTIELIEKEHIEELNVFELGDSIQGILRLNSQLMQLRYGVVESAILYAEYMAGWLTELSKHVVVKFQMVRDSNHSQIRLCNAPKNAFPDENMGIVIEHFLKERLKDNPRIHIIENPTGMNCAVIAGFYVLGIHGEVKNLGRACGEFARAYGAQVDYIIGAHVHHSMEAELGMNSEAISIRSIVGTDPYGLSLRRTSDAGASLLVFDKNKGLTCDYRIKFNN